MTGTYGNMVPSHLDEHTWRERYGLSLCCLICNATLQSDICSHDVVAAQCTKTGSLQSHQHVSEEVHVIIFGTCKVKVDKRYHG